MTHALRARLTGRAARFVSLLEEFGHLDELGVNDLLVAVAEARGGSEERPVDLPEVRRVAARFFFERDPAAEEGDGLVAEDWPLLFY